MKGLPAFIQKGGKQAYLLNTAMYWGRGRISPFTGPPAGKVGDETQSTAGYESVRSPHSSCVRSLVPNTAVFKAGPVQVTGTSRFSGFIH